MRFGLAHSSLIMSYSSINYVFKVHNIIMKKCRLLQTYLLLFQYFLYHCILSWSCIPSCYVVRSMNDRSGSEPGLIVRTWSVSVLVYDPTNQLIIVYRPKWWHFSIIGNGCKIILHIYPVQYSQLTP